MQKTAATTADTVNPKTRSTVFKQREVVSLEMEEKDTTLPTGTTTISSPPRQADAASSKVVNFKAKAMACKQMELKGRK